VSDYHVVRLDAIEPDPSLHVYLIDDEGRGWCGDRCVRTDTPHWVGQLPEDRWVLGVND